MKIAVQIQDHYKALKLLEFLRSLDFVRVLEAGDTEGKMKSREDISEPVDFFSYAGLWENRDLTAETLRQQAWRQYSV